MNTVKNIIRSEMNTTATQEQIVGPSYFNIQALVGGSSKRPMNEAETIKSPKTGQQSVAPNPQTGGTFGPQIAPATYHITRDHDEAFF